MCISADEEITIAGVNGLHDGISLLELTHPATLRWPTSLRLWRKEVSCDYSPFSNFSISSKNCCAKTAWFQPEPVRKFFTILLPICCLPSCLKSHKNNGNSNMPNMILAISQLRDRGVHKSKLKNILTPTTAHSG